MSCYSYSSNDPIYFEPNLGIWSVERVYNVGDTYSYAAIARMCEIADKDQLCVYTRPSPTGIETKLTLNIDYTVNTANERIDLINVPASGQVVVRRCTSNTKMFIPFTEGAKLTAQQLNTSLYQLLFIAQEKEFVGSTINQYYPIAIAASAWNSGTSYVTNNYVLHNGNIYRALANNTNSQPPSANWTLINPATNGFVIEGSLTGPVKFDLTGATVGKGLIWNGTKFETGYISGPLNDLSDVTINTAIDKQLLRYDGTVSQWKNVSPTVDITLANPIFQSHIFVNQSTSYTNNNTTFPTIDPSLNIFRTGLNSEWTIASIPTVWHALNIMTPGYVAGTPSTYFNNFLSYVNTIIGQVAQAVSNPVKVKLYWNLNKGRSNIADAITGDNLQDYRSTFWDNPNELYNTGMWLVPENCKYHGVATSAPVTYKQNPYWNYDGIIYNSKISGYGIKSKGFYLSVPECYTTSLTRIPILSNTPTTWNNHVYTVLSDITTAKLTSCDENIATYRDTYLEGLRDMMSASTISKESTYSATPTVEDSDKRSRYAKGWILHADYNGFENISFKRLEISAETAKSCLFKIPKQIIYYNKASLSWANSSLTALNTSDTPASWPNTIDGGAGSSSVYSKQTRFTGPGKLHYPATLNVNSTTSYTGMGGLYKADSIWSNWCNSWSTSATTYRFNEADIEWHLKGLTTNSGTFINLFDSINDSYLSTGNTVGTGASTAVIASKQYPWPYRSLYYDHLNTYFDGYIGTHHFNVDTNRLFSDAVNFIPDPRDEYVFRLVVSDTLLNTFIKPNSDIASSIILEHGFSDLEDNGSTTTKILANAIFNKNQIVKNSNRAKSRLNKNDVKVFIQNEHIETVDGTSGNKQYVITLCISVPRLKSIGYARIYRSPNSYTTGIQYNIDSINNSGTADIENDLGTWSLYFDNINRSITDTAAATQIIGANTFIQYDVPEKPIYSIPTNQISSYSLNTYSWIAGRNECAVKFTRLGIPSDLWIRLSVLNTDGTTSLLTTSGVWS